MRELVAVQNKREAAHQRRTHKNESITQPDSLRRTLGKAAQAAIDRVMRDELILHHSLLTPQG